MAETISTIVGPLQDRRCVLCDAIVRNASPRLKYCFPCSFKIASVGGIRKYLKKYRPDLRVNKLVKDA